MKIPRITNRIQCFFSGRSSSGGKNTFFVGWPIEGSPGSPHKLFHLLQRHLSRHWATCCCAVAMRDKWKGATSMWIFSGIGMDRIIPPCFTNKANKIHWLTVHQLVYLVHFNQTPQFLDICWIISHGFSILVPWWFLVCFPMVFPMVFSSHRVGNQVSPPLSWRPATVIKTSTFGARCGEHHAITLFFFGKITELTGGSPYR